MQQLDKQIKAIRVWPLKIVLHFINCITDINNTQLDNAKDIDIVMPMYNLTEYSDNYAKTSGSLWQYYRDEPNDNLTDYKLFKSKMKITGNTPAAANGSIKIFK